MKPKIVFFLIAACDQILSLIAAIWQQTTGLGGRYAAMHQMIDVIRVNELRDEIGADDFEEVVQMFLDEADEVIARITSLDNAKSIESDLHFLKGAALNLGFSAFAALCQDGERRAASGETGLDIDAVKQCYELSKSVFTKKGLCAGAA